jgi:N-ethylmaleimide reductase
LYSDQQVEGWKKIVDAVHARGSRIFSQLWHTGRSSHIATSGHTPVSASVNPAYWEDKSHLVLATDGWTLPSPHRALDIAEIPGIVEDYGKAAMRAKAAGFDGLKLNDYDRETFYSFGPQGYTDYPAYKALVSA